MKPQAQTVIPEKAQDRAKTESVAEFKRKRKEDALALAYVIYDIYKQKHNKPD